MRIGILEHHTGNIESGYNDAYAIEIVRQLSDLCLDDLEIIIDYKYSSANSLIYSLAKKLGIKVSNSGTTVLDIYELYVHPIEPGSDVFYTTASSRLVGESDIVYLLGHLAPSWYNVDTDSDNVTLFKEEK